MRKPCFIWPTSGSLFGILNCQAAGKFFRRTTHMGKPCTNVPTSIIFPAITILCVFGSYSINNKTWDILIMISFGIVSYIILLFEMSPSPFLIAFILGPKLERGLRRALSISDGSLLIFIQSPIAIFFYILTMLAIISIYRGAFKKIT